MRQILIGSFSGKMKEISEGDVAGLLDGGGKYRVRVRVGSFPAQQINDAGLGNTAFFHFGPKRVNGFQIGIDVRFGKNNVKADRLGAVLLQLSHHLRDRCPGPGPPAQFGKAFFIDDGNDGFTAWLQVAA